MADNRPRITRTRRAVKFRQLYSVRSRIATVLICSALICVIAGFGTVMYGWSNLPNTQTGRILIGLNAFPLLFIVLALIGPQVMVRISPRGVARARTFPFPRRFFVRWDDIERVRWGSSAIVLKSPRHKVWIGMRYMPHQEQSVIRRSIADSLGGRFELSEAGLVELREAASRWSPVLIAVIAAHLIAYPIMFFVFPAHKPAIMLALILSSAIAVVLHTLRMNRLMWRLPHQR